MTESLREKDREKDREREYTVTRKKEERDPGLDPPAH